MNSRVDQDGPVPGIGLRGRREVIYTTSLDVDRGNFSVVMLRQDSEFDGSAPSRWFQYRRDVIVSWSAVTTMSSHGVSGIEEHLPEDRLRPRHHVLPDVIRDDCELLEVTLTATVRRTFPNFLGLPDVLLKHDGNGRKQTGVIIRYDLITPF